MSETLELAGATRELAEATRYMADAIKESKGMGETVPFTPTPGGSSAGSRLPYPPTSSPECPYCGGRMVVRNRKADGAPFWGCASYPECRGIVNYDDSPKEPVTGKPREYEMEDEDIPF